MWNLDQTSADSQHSYQKDTSGGGWNYNWTWWTEAADAGGEERLFDFADDGLPVICTAANASGPNALDPAVFNECVAHQGARRRG